MFDHRVENLIVGDGRLQQPKLCGRRALFAQDIAWGALHRLQQLLELWSIQPVLRYSTTTGSYPAARIIASVFRDVPQSGLWKIVIGKLPIKVTPRQRSAA